MGFKDRLSAGGIAGQGIPVGDGVAHFFKRNVIETGSAEGKAPAAVEAVDDDL